jgi:hypothetical protein
MDPYLEAPSLWPDVHHRLISTIGDQIQAKLTPSYRAVITPYAVFESIEIAPVRRVVPDVAVVEREPLGLGGGAAAAVEAAPLTLPAVMTVSVEYARIEIRTVRDQVLVTAIELLSPANKRPGLDGADAYEKKRQELFSSMAHLLEIDLLRAGTRPQVARTLLYLPQPGRAPPEHRDLAARAGRGDQAGAGAAALPRPAGDPRSGRRHPRGLPPRPLRPGDRLPRAAPRARAPRR